MDAELLKQLAGASQDQLQAIMAQINAAGGQREEEELQEDEKMENVKQTYDMFIQNQLSATSHTLEWLPIGHQDPVNTKFDLQYFILGTHIERADDESAAPDDKL